MHKLRKNHATFRNVMQVFFVFQFRSVCIVLQRITSRCGLYVITLRCIEFPFMRRQSNRKIVV